MNEITVAMGSIAAALIGLAIVAVLVSKQAQTPQVLQSAGTAFSAVIAAAVAPVTGAAGTTSTLGNLLSNSTGGWTV
jgi:hypothetical protein